MTLSARRLLARAARAGRGALNLTVYPLVARARRDRKRWAFGHQDDLFGGNAKYLYLWASLHRPDIEAVWITGDRALRDRLRAAGFTYFTERVQSDKGALTRVRVGPVLSRAEAERLRAQLSAKAGVSGIVRPHP